MASSAVTSSKLRWMAASASARNRLTLIYAMRLRPGTKVIVLISHAGVDRREMLDVLRRRWPDVVLKDLEHEEPMWGMTPDDAADLGNRRRGLEPLRIMVMPQKTSRVTVASTPEIAPMPMIV